MATTKRYEKDIRHNWPYMIELIAHNTAGGPNLWLARNRFYNPVCKVWLERGDHKLFRMFEQNAGDTDEKVWLWNDSCPPYRGNRFLMSYLSRANLLRRHKTLEAEMVYGPDENFRPEGRRTREWRLGSDPYHR